MMWVGTPPSVLLFFPGQFLPNSGNCLMVITMGLGRHLSCTDGAQEIPPLPVLRQTGAQITVLQWLR